MGPYFNHMERLNVQLITDAVGDAADVSHDKNPSQFIIVSGDSDIYPAILTIASKRSFPVFFLSRKNELTKNIEEKSGGVYIHNLDELKTLAYDASNSDLPPLIALD